MRTDRPNHRRVLVALMSLALLLAACGGGDDGSPGDSSTGGSDPPKTTAETTAPTGSTGGTVSTFTEQSSVTTGCYQTEELTDPTVTVCVEGTWWFDIENENAIGMVPAATYIQTKNLLVLKADRVIDPVDQETVVDAPDDLVHWFIDNPDFEVVGRPRPVTVGGIEGRQVDVRAVDPPPCTIAGGGGGRCWLVMPLFPGDPFSPAAQGPPVLMGTAVEHPDVLETYRIVSLVVDGQPIAIAFDDLPDEFPESVKVFEQVLDGIQWS